MDVVSPVSRSVFIRLGRGDVSICPKTEGLDNHEYCVRYTAEYPPDQILATYPSTSYTEQQFDTE